MKYKKLPLYYFTETNTFIGYISWFAIYTTLFATFTFIGNSLVGMLFAFLVIVLNVRKLRLTWNQFIAVILCVFYFTIVMSYSYSYVVVLQNIRYWFGLLLYIMFFKVFIDFIPGHPVHF